MGMDYPLYGGIPYGRLMVFAGLEHSGKTTAACAAIAAYQRENPDKVYILTFMGVISSLDLYINGDFVGYSEGAHNSAEFNISDYLQKGENEILAVVSKWSTGTYLECQDMFRENGIFDTVTADAFRYNVLELGNTKDPMELYVNFRTKQPSITPLLRNRGLL